MTSLAFRLITALFIVTLVVSVGFAFQTKKQSEEQISIQSTAFVAQLYETTTALGSTVQAHAQETATVAFSIAQQTIAAQSDVQATRITAQLRKTQQAALSAQYQRIIATQVYGRATQIAHDQIVRQTQVANAVRQTVLAIPSATLIPTSTPAAPKINVLIEGCTTGLDAIRRRLGAVTNAYVTVANVGQVDVSSVVVALISSDASSQHPDRQKFIQYLPVGHQVTVDLTTDADLINDSGIKVIVTTKEAVVEHAERSDCKELDPATLEEFARVLRLVIPIPKIPIAR